MDNWYSKLLTNTLGDTAKPCYCTGPQNGQPRCPCKMRSGFFDLPPTDQCQHPEHNFPTHIYIPPGQGYRHVCPGCGYTQTVASHGVWCDTVAGTL